MRYTGKISFSLYLWHLLVLQVIVTPGIGQYGAGVWIPFMVVAVTLFVTYLWAAGAYTLVEAPFLALKRRTSDENIFTAH